MKRHKDPVNTPIGNGDPEVFVLSPDLLEKLGIQLSNITQPEGSSGNYNVEQCTKTKPENLLKSTDEPSMLETASLMKQSVFMSPTFVSTTDAETISEPIAPNNVALNYNLIQNVNEQQKNDVNNVLDTGNSHETKDLEEFKSINKCEVENAGLILTNNVVYEPHDIDDVDLSSFNNTLTCVDDHADEAYSSDGSNCNTGALTVPTSLEISLKQQTSCNKIKILSEQIIHHSDLNSIQNSRIKKSSCFLIPVNTIVTGKPIRERSNNNLDQNSDRVELETNSQINNNINKVDIKNHKLETVIDKDTMLEDLMGDTNCPRTIDPNVIKEESNHKDKTDEECAINDDSKNRKEKEDDKNSILKDKISNDCITETVSNTEKSSGMSKLCIQGVEKPGGMHSEKNVDIIVKTYQRTNARKRIPSLPRVDNKYTVDLNMLSKDLIDLDIIHIGGYKNANKFCVCKDFGQLAHYDSDIVYEHLHFCDRNSVSCNLETLFSMYDDTSDGLELKILEDIDVAEVNEKNIHRNICWLSFEHENNDDNLEYDIMKSDISDQLKSSPVQLRRSNRKRKSTTENITENTESKSKKTVKCGACGLILAEAEWNKHNDSEHNLIGWKDGQTIGKHITTVSSNDKLNVNAIEKNDTTQKHTKTTRSTSRNLEDDVSEIPVQITVKAKKTNNEIEVGASSKQTDTSFIEDALKPNKTGRDVYESTENTDSSKSGVIQNTKESKQVSLKVTQSMSLEKFLTDLPKSIDVSSKSPKKPIDVTADVERLKNSKEVDIFSISKKTNKSESQIKSLKKSKTETNFSKSDNDAITSKSIKNPNESSEKTEKVLKVEESHKKLKKSLDAEASSNNSEKSASKLINVATSRANVEVVKKLKEIDIFAVSTPKKPTKIESQTKSMKKSKNETNFSKPEDTILKSKRNSRNASVEKRNRITEVENTNKVDGKSHADAKSNNDVIEMNVTESKVNSKSHKNLATVNIKVPPLNETQNSVNVEIEILPHNDTAVDTTILRKSLTRKSAQGLVKSTSDSNTKNKEFQPNIVQVKKEILAPCGVCKQQVDDTQWNEHIAKEHDYLAWREDETPLDLTDDDEIRAHLYTIAKANGGLRCSKCLITRKYVKSYLLHIKSCTGDEEQQDQMDASTASMDTTLDLDDVPLKSYPRENLTSVVCGVCNETVLKNKWIDHIRLEHKYLAWIRGETPLDVEDDVAVKAFLRNISNYNGGLICSKCGTVRAYVKSWMAHEATCKGVPADDSMNGSVNKGAYIEFEISSDTVKCAKCGQEMPGSTWMDHIEKEHNYLSWIEGQPPLDESDPVAVTAYLFSIVRKRGVLYCVKCGVTRKYPKAFLTHISACEISGFKREDFFVEVSLKIQPGEFECAICHETGIVKDWKKHAMRKHYNVAWMAGDIPINLKNFYAVEKYLKEYKAKHSLVCEVCGASRTSCYGFYAHILTCGKSEEEIEHLMEMCEICNNKFLCIYRNQHRAMHKEQMIKKEQKEQRAIKAEEEQKLRETVEAGEPSSGRRRAAEKAKKVMEKYTTTITDGNNVCASCHVEFDDESQLKKHVCRVSKVDASDSDVSMKGEGQEESEDDMEDIDSNISDEEEDPMKRKRHPESIPKITLPFKVKDFNYFLSKSFEHFCEMHYTDDCLYNNWRRNDYKILLEDEWSRYLPLLLESCRLRLIDGEWDTFQRFEAKRKKDTIIFTGATVRCMQWVPHSTTDVPQNHYLSVSCFREADCPRYRKDELPQHPGMLQIWNMNQFLSTPKLAMGIAHDYGTIWAMDWCPSGARDLEPSEDTVSRLGLVAIACSNGCAYILSVPCLQETDDEPVICKLNPVAELRLSMKPTQPPFRIGYQATSISWSPQKGHDVVMVGYADGTTALYDLNTESPLLKETENGVDIFYPFQDALAENSTITGVALCASADLRRAVGGVATASATGATMAGWPRGPTVRSHLAASSVTYTPNWPAALLCSDDVLTLKSTNEMEWWGGGRRLGGACAAAGCARCGRVCLTAPPFVRVLRAHPAYPEIKKQIVATVKMVPLARKRKLVTDDLGMVVEPLTYDETIKKYGLEFKALPKKEQTAASKLYDNAEQCAERFPLSDLPAAAFCPTANHHQRLAIASHAGFVFIITT